MTSRNPLWQFFLLGLRPLLRERGVIFWSFGFPIIMTILFTSTFSSKREAEPIRVAVVDSQKIDPAWLESAKKSQSVTLTDISNYNEEERHRFLVDTGADLIWTPGRLQTIAPPDRARSGVDRLLALRTDAPRLEVERLEVAGSRYSDWFAGGMIALAIVTSMMTGAAVRLSNDIHSGFLTRLRLSPFKMSDYLAGFIFSRMVFAAFNVTVLTTFFWWIYGFSIQGPLWVFALIGFIGLFCAGLLGTFIAVLSSSVEAALGITNFIMFPMTILSGVYFRIELLPSALKSMAPYIPIAALASGFRDVANLGLGVAGVIRPLCVLLSWIAVSFFIILWVFALKTRED